MLYQPSGIGLLFLFGIDLAALALLYFLVRSPLRWKRVLLYGSAMLVVLFSSFLKSLFSNLDSILSSPSDLHIENRLNGSFQTFYYLDESKTGQLQAFWKEYMLGRYKTRTLEMEGFYGLHGLLIAKKLNGQWQYQRVLPHHLTAVLDPTHFHPDPSGRVARAVWAYFGIELGVYLSELLTLAVLFLLVQRLPAAFRKQPDTPYIDVVPAR